MMGNERAGQPRGRIAGLRLAHERRRRHQRGGAARQGAAKGQRGRSAQDPGRGRTRRHALRTRAAARPAGGSGRGRQPLAEASITSTA
ncbi:MAG: hypothetical protein MZW92_65620 [Comamonadaceae bacterium]|nr:hypothetical protein [Comamonadaceae bacterium]